MSLKNDTSLSQMGLYPLGKGHFIVPEGTVSPWKRALHCPRGDCIPLEKDTSLSQRGLYPLGKGHFIVPEGTEFPWKLPWHFSMPDKPATPELNYPDTCFQTLGELLENFTLATSLKRYQVFNIFTPAAHNTLIFNFRSKGLQHLAHHQKLLKGWKAVKGGGGGCTDM